MKPVWERQLRGDGRLADLGDGGWNINCLTFATGGGPAVNLTAGKSAGESCHVQACVSGKATDADQNICWDGFNNVFPQWIQVDLGSAQGVGRFVLPLPVSRGVRDQTLALLVSREGPTVIDSDSFGHVHVVSVERHGHVTFPATAQRYSRVVAADTGWPAGQVCELAHLLSPLASPIGLHYS